MIISEAELRAALGLQPTITDQQNMHVTLAMQLAHAAIRQHIRYDPEQKVGPAEFYPRIESNRDFGAGDVWDVDRAMTKAIYEDRSGDRKYLQLQRLPVRTVSSVYVDIAARFGQAAEDFADSTLIVQGVDYAIEYDQNRLCLTGHLVSLTAWPSTPGTVKVTYRAGYSPLEFMGPQDADSTDADGNITTQGVDASPLKAATLLTAMAQYHTLLGWSQNSLGIIAAGPKSSETLGSYSYSLAGAEAAAKAAGMQVMLTPQAAALAESFVNYGIMLAAA